MTSDQSITIQRERELNANSFPIAGNKGDFAVIPSLSGLLRDFNDESGDTSSVIMCHLPSRAVIYDTGSRSSERLTRRLSGTRIAASIAQRLGGGGAQ